MFYEMNTADGVIECCFVLFQWIQRYKVCTFLSLFSKLSFSESTTNFNSQKKTRLKPLNQTLTHMFYRLYFVEGQAQTFSKKL